LLPAGADLARIDGLPVVVDEVASGFRGCGRGGITDERREAFDISCPSRIEAGIVPRTLGYVSFCSNEVGAIRGIPVGGGVGGSATDEGTAGIVRRFAPTEIRAADRSIERRGSEAVNGEAVLGRVGISLRVTPLIAGGRSG